LQIEQGGQVAIGDADACRRRDDGLCVISDAEPGASDHVEIVGAVPDRQRVVRRNPELPNSVLQCRQLGFASQDRFAPLRPSTLKTEESTPLVLTFDVPDGTRLAYHRKGSGGDRPLVCIPGGPMMRSAYFGDLGGLAVANSNLSFLARIPDMEEGKTGIGLTVSRIIALPRQSR